MQVDPLNIYTLLFVTLTDSVNNPSMKEVKGLGDRLFGLEQLLIGAKKYLQEQAEMAQVSSPRGPVKFNTVHTRNKQFKKSKKGCFLAVGGRRAEMPDCACVHCHTRLAPQVRPKKKVFDWRNPTDPIYPADPTYFY